MIEISNTVISTTPFVDKPVDGIGMCDGNHYYFRDCIIDLTNWPQEKTDEACGITWGSSAVFENCVIRGAGKLILGGCGDDPDDPENEKIRDKILAERGKTIDFRYCILENFCRRGPEVQGGMVVGLYSSLVFNWGYNKKFDTRAFGAWAHNGGVINANKTIFLKGDGPTLWHWLLDHIKHFGQAVNERGFFKALFHRDAWLSGYKRALTAGPDGVVTAEHCYATEGLVVDNHKDPMNEKEAYERLTELFDMRARLGDMLDWHYPD